MKIWEVDDANSGQYPYNAPIPMQNTASGEYDVPNSYGLSDSRYSPYISTGPTAVESQTFPIMSPTYDQPAQSYDPYQTSGPLYGAGPQPSGKFAPILPPGFMQDEDNPPSTGHYVSQQPAMLGPTLLQQQMMAAPSQPPQPQQQQYPPGPGQAPGGFAPPAPQPPYTSVADMAMPMPALGNLVTRETDRINRRNRMLYLAVLLLALFILAAIVALIVISVITAPPSSSSQAAGVSTTTIKFTVARIDMAYGDELKDINTYAYLSKKKQFCDMISSAYLTGAFDVTKCDILKFSPGSVEAIVKIVVINGDKSTNEVLYYVGQILQAKSDADISTKVIQPSSIVLVND